MLTLVLTPGLGVSTNKFQEKVLTPGLGVLTPNPGVSTWGEHATLGDFCSPRNWGEHPPAHPRFGGDTRPLGYEIKVAFLLRWN